MAESQKPIRIVFIYFMIFSLASVGTLKQLPFIRNDVRFVSPADTEYIFYMHSYMAYAHRMNEFAALHDARQEIMSFYLAYSMQWREKRMERAVAYDAGEH